MISPGTSPVIMLRPFLFPILRWLDGNDQAAIRAAWAIGLIAMLSAAVLLAVHPARPWKHLAWTLTGSFAGLLAGVVLNEFLVADLFLYDHMGGIQSKICMIFSLPAGCVVGITATMWLRRRRRPPDPTRCAGCGYPRIGLPPNRCCPECGKATPSSGKNAARKTGHDDIT